MLKLFVLLCTIYLNVEPTSGTEFYASRFWDNILYQVHDGGPSVIWGCITLPSYVAKRTTSYKFHYDLYFFNGYGCHENKNFIFIPRGYHHDINQKTVIYYHYANGKWLEYPLTFKTALERFQFVSFTRVEPSEGRGLSFPDSSDDY